MPGRSARGGQAPTSREDSSDRVGIEKLPTGIAGLDEVMRGGIPLGRTTMVFGSPGAGKTILALQTLVNGIRKHNRPGIFVAFEEEPKQIVANASTFGWNLSQLLRRGLSFLDARLDPEVLHSGKFDLSAILAALQVKAKDTGTQCVIFDGIDVLLTLLEDPAAERAELHRINGWLQRNRLRDLSTESERFRSPPFCE